MELGEGKRALGGSQISPLFRLPPHSPGDAPGPSAPCHHPRPPSLGVPLPPIPLLTGQDPSLEPDRAAPSTVDQKLQKKNPFQAPFPSSLLSPSCPQVPAPAATSAAQSHGDAPGGSRGGPTAQPWSRAEQEPVGTAAPASAEPLPPAQRGLCAAVPSPPLPAARTHVNAIRSRHSWRTGGATRARLSWWPSLRGKRRGRRVRKEKTDPRRLFGVGGCVG